MARSKIDYGIDLGTTNSAISRMESGEPTIKKTDTLKDTMPSCVSFNKKKTARIGDGAYNALKSDKRRATKTWSKTDSNAFIEFKRTMGTDKKYPSSFMEKEFSSEELSAEVLKTLKSYVTDETINSIVITVPAKFTINQKDATARAAKIAGFEHCELLQEPIAASMAYGLDAKSKEGFWLVFDFGGGTFDAALLKVEEGIMKVIDTEGDNWLGGKNIDLAIVDEIILPYLKENYSIDEILGDDQKKEVLREAMKTYAEDVKIQLSFKDSEDIISTIGDLGEDDEGEEIELDLTVTIDQLREVIAPIYQKSIDICKQLLERNSIATSSLDALILVGGPTYSPILRKMLEEQIAKPDTSSDPMTAVAKGAALFASTIDVSEEIKEKTRDKSKIQIEIGYESTWVEKEQLITIKYNRDKTEGEIPEKVFAEIVRGDKGWSSGKVEIDGTGEAIEVELILGRANQFNVNLYDENGNSLESEPKDFTIIGGTKIGSATLSYHMGIEIKRRTNNKIVFEPIKGVEKNQSFPATGVRRELKTQKQIRPGIADDIIKIPLYQGDNDAKGSRAIYNEHVYDATISGDDLPALLPEGSEVELTIKVLSDKDITMSAYFPYLDHTIDLKVPTDTVQSEVDAKWLESEIQKALQTLNLIKQEGTYSDSETLDKLGIELNDIQKRFEQGKGDYDRKKEVLENLRRSLRKLDDIQDASEWPKTEEELKDVYYRLEETNKELGNEKTTAVVEQFKEQIPQVIKEQNVKVARELIDNMRHLDFMLIDQGLGAQMEIGLLQQFNEDFDSHDWSDRNKARTLINQGLQMAANNPSKQKLRPVVIELYKLLPDVKQPILSGDDSVLTD